MNNIRILCSRCHDLLMMSMNLSDVAIFKIKNNHYCCIIIGTSKSEAIKLLQNIDLAERMWNIIKLNIKSNFEALNLFQILI